MTDGAGPPGPLDVSVASLAEGYRSGRWDPVEVVAASRARLQGVGTELGAVTEVLDTGLAEAEQRAVELTAGNDRGPLHGVPVVVKELIDVAGSPRSAGSQVHPEGWDAPRTADAGVVADVRRAGAVVVARTRTHEFAWGITTRHPDGGGVVNPLDRSRIAGGSSGGTAALVAAGCAPVGLGTDTGGSVRIPSAFCGLVGWKPGVGRLSTRGVVPLAPTFDHVGVLVRRVDDAVMVDDALSAGLTPERSDPRPAPAGPATGAPRAAVLEDPSLPPVQDGIAAAVAEACARAGIGTVLSAGPGPDDLPPAAEMVRTFAAIQRAEALAVHRDLLGTWPSEADHYGEDVAGRLREAEHLDPVAVVEAGIARREVQAAWHRAFAAAEVDALVLPTTACGPPSVADPDTARMGGRAVPLRAAVMPFTIPANLTGWPALVVPGPPPQDGIPASIQIIARPGAAHLLPELAAQLLPPDPRH